MEKAKEDYLKTIYGSEQASSELKPSLLAELLGVSKAAVTDMLKKLDKLGFIQYQSYRPIALTEKGRKAGALVTRRHRLWELFLHEKLGFDWAEVHDEAERLEHASSDRLMNKIDESLGFPKSDPHGSPIPNHLGELEDTVSYVPLSSLAILETGIVRRVRSMNPEFLQFLKTHQICLGARVTVLRKQSFDGSVVVKVEDQELTLSDIVSNSIWLEKDLNEGKGFRK